MMYLLSGDYRMPCEGPLVPETFTDTKTFFNPVYGDLVYPAALRARMTRREKDRDEGATICLEILVF